MSNKTILHEFNHKQRKYLITLDISMEDGNETILLSEQITVHGNPLKHFSQTNGVLNKTEPLVFANRNNDEKEIEISMQYEGLPVEPLNIFLEVIGEKWNEKTTKLPLRS